MVARREKDGEGAPRASVAGFVTGGMTTFRQQDVEEQTEPSLFRIV